MYEVHHDSLYIRYPNQEKPLGYIAGDSGTSGGKCRWKPDFVTTNMFHGKPEKLSKAGAAEVDAQMSSDPECRCRPLVTRLTHSPSVFHLFDRDRERVAELSAKDVPESE
jgi:hypothetical protein